MSLQFPFRSMSLLARLSLLSVLAAAVLSAGVTTTSILRFSDRSTVDGASSTLVRNDAGITMTFLTSDLDSGATYTIWWIIFNNPEHCATPHACAGGDLAPRGGDPAVQSSVGLATGRIVLGSGVGEFGAHLAPGDATGFRFGPGLIDPMKAEIHLVVRTHGPPIPGMEDDQTSSLNAGCPPNTCEDHQFAIHIPGMDMGAQNQGTILECLEELKTELERTKALLDRVAIRAGIRP